MYDAQTDLSTQSHVYAHTSGWCLGLGWGEERNHTGGGYGVVGEQFVNR